MLVHDLQAGSVYHLCFYKIFPMMKPQAQIAYEHLVLQGKAGYLNFEAFFIAERSNGLVKVAVHHWKIHVVREIELIGNS